MNANELRIGNYYNYDGIPIKLDGGFLGEYLLNDVPLSLEPIPLNEQWLMDFGFIKLDYFYILESEMNLKVGYDLKKFAWHNFQLHNVNIKHVHQLQNLYFALTGIELIKKI